MAKIIKLDPTGKKPDRIKQGKEKGCDHKNVIAYTVFRTVRCTACGTLLDPFDVLVDMLKGYVPPDANNLEEKRLRQEISKRDKAKLNDDEAGSE